MFKCGQAASDDTVAWARDQDHDVVLRCRSLSAPAEGVAATLSRRPRRSTRPGRSLRLGQARVVGGPAQANHNCGHDGGRPATSSLQKFCLHPLNGICTGRASWRLVSTTDKHWPVLMCQWAMLALQGTGLRQWAPGPSWPDLALAASLACES